MSSISRHDASRIVGATGLDDRGTALAPWLAPRFILAAILGSVVVALVLGIPTDLVPNPWFVRMIPPGFSNYFFWISTSLLTGALFATYVMPRVTDRGPGGAGIGSGFLGLLAAGCPICNKLVLLLLGASGALNYFAPIQPLLGAAGLLVAGIALFFRLRDARSACRVPV